MELVAEARENLTIIRVNCDRIDAAGAIEFKDKFREAADNDHDRVVLDMSQVGFLDSSGLGAIVASMKFLGANRKLELASLTPTVEKVFNLTRLNDVFTIHALAGDVFQKDLGNS